MRNNTIPRLKEKIRTLKECCFSREELETLLVALPKQKYTLSPRLVITCSLPRSLRERVRQLAETEKIENNSSFYRSCLSSYLTERYIPPLPKYYEKEKVDCSFHLDQKLWNTWNEIPKGQRVNILEAWAWFLLAKLEKPTN